MSSVRRRIAAGLLATAALVVPVACGEDARELAGYRRDPAPSVASISLPELTNGGAEFSFVADPDELLVVYFGYTNCPDFCPTTMSDLKLARQRLDDPDRVGVAMVTVDPDRDLDVLARYVTSFMSDAHALGTTDAAALARAAAPFGASYEVSTAADGKVEVAHTTSLYAIDDSGQLVLTWQFGVPIEDLAGDLEQLLEEAAR